MRKIMICTMLALGVTAVTPALAQSVYVGPNGVGVDTGIRHHRDYERDRYDRYHDRDSYEGRSVYSDRDYGDRGYRDHY